MPATVLDQARRWLRECYDQGGPRGKIFIGNLATDLTIGAVDSTLCLEFLTGVCKQLATTSESADHSQTPIILDSPVDLARNALASAFFLRGPKIPCSTDWFCKLALARDVINNLNFNFAARVGWPRSLDVKTAYAQLKASGNYAQMIKPHAYLRGYSPLNWLAPTEEVKSAIETEKDLDKQLTSDKQLTRARDLLGLQHFSADDVLLLLLIPKSATAFVDMHEAPLQAGFS